MAVPLSKSHPEEEEKDGVLLNCSFHSLLIPTFPVEIFFFSNTKLGVSRLQFGSSLSTPLASERPLTPVICHAWQAAAGVAPQAQAPLQVDF